MVTLRNGDVVPTFNALSNLGKLPAGLAKLKVARLIAALLPDARRIEHEHRDLIEQHSTPDGKSIDPAKRQQFRAEETKLLEAKTEIGAGLLTQADLNEISVKTELDPGLLAFLLPFVESGAE